MHPHHSHAERLKLDRCSAQRRRKDNPTGVSLERARFQPGETILVNGATGAAGLIAVQVAKQLGTGKVIVTGRNAQELDTLRPLGADGFAPIATPHRLNFLNLSHMRNSATLVHA